MIAYVKDKQIVKIAPKFIYHCSVYKCWSKGAALLSEKYYATKHPLNLKKIPSILKKKNFTIQRFLELESAPEEYLIAKGYKQKEL